MQGGGCGQDIFTENDRLVNEKAHGLDDWVTLTQEFRSGLARWGCFVETWNARGMMEVMRRERWHDLECYTDASGSWGCVTVTGLCWFPCPWEGCWDDQCIAARELLPIAIACVVWGPRWAVKLVLVHCDNRSVVHIMQSQTS